MTNLFKRINDLISANINGLIDHTEDPNAVKQIISEMQENISKTKEASSGEKEFEINQRQVAEWLSRAQATRQRQQLEAKLHKGLIEQELRVYYQPQIDIVTGKIVGAEALIRWQKFNELVLPIDFIPVAGQTSLIIEIGAWVLQETCQQGQQWLKEGLPPITLAVNVAAPQIKRSNMVSLVSKVLEQTHFQAAQLELEITECDLMEDHDVEFVLEILNNLHALGIRLAIDDFGTGYSSLTHLKRFPLDKIKIDRSFINAISYHHNDIGIANTVITMAHSLACKVLAEGVETEEQLSFLREKGCDFYQGYIKSKPIPAAEFAVLLREQKK